MEYESSLRKANIALRLHKQCECESSWPFIFNGSEARLREGCCGTGTGSVMQQDDTPLHDKAEPR